MFFTLLLIIIGTLILLLATLNLWLPSVLKMVVEKFSNFPTSVKKSNCSLTKGIVDLENVTIDNPKNQFEKENFVRVNKLRASVVYQTLTQPTIVIPEVTLDLDNITCEQNKDGKLNAMVLVESFLGPSSEEESKKDEEPKKEEEQTNAEGEKKETSSPFKIGTLSIRLGTIEVYNMTSEKGEVKVALNKTLTFKDVTLDKKNDIILEILQDQDLQNAGVSMAMQAAIGKGKQIITDNVKKVADAGQKMLNDYIPPETVDSIKDAIPDEIKSKVSDHVESAVNQVKQSIPNDIPVKVPEAAKETAQKISQAIPDDAKKAIGNKLKGLFG